MCLTSEGQRLNTIQSEMQPITHSAPILLRAISELRFASGVKDAGMVRHSASYGQTLLNYYVFIISFCAHNYFINV
jgi:hypothetical protein